MISEDVTTETQKLNLPADLLAEVARRKDKRQSNFHVEGLKPSLLERLAQMFGLN
jgi:hypothetical protein